MKGKQMQDNFPKKRKKAAPIFGAASFLCRKLSAQTEFLDDSPVSLDVNFLEVVKNATSFTYELEKCTACAEVLLVGFKMLGEVSDTVGEQSYLALWRTCVSVGLSVFRENLLFFLW